MINEGLQIKSEQDDTEYAPIDETYYPLTPPIKVFLERLKANNDIYYPGSNFLFPDESQELGCITLYVTYRAHRYVCNKLGIPVNKEIPKGPHSFRRNHLTGFVELSGNAMLGTNLYGNSVKAFDQYYALSYNAATSAPFVEAFQTKIFGDSLISE
ncbi:MAG: hypothetical protein IKQ83_07055 [Lachnospiraceae bacterium]|nr:hypothetical protein [Lachnospiraceae bacterium]